MADYEEGMIDLGKEMENDGCCKPSSTSDVKSGKKTIHYPSLYISDVKELDDLPDGEFYFTAVGKVTRHSEDDPINGESHCSCEITVLKMKPTGMSKKKKSKSSEESLDDALDTVAQKKADAEEDMMDDGADEEYED